MTFKTLSQIAWLQAICCVLLFPHPACAAPTDLTTQVTTANQKGPDQPLNTPAVELPVTWSAIFYLAVGLTKVILSLLTILVNTCSQFIYTSSRSIWVMQLRAKNQFTVEDDACWCLWLRTVASLSSGPVGGLKAQRAPRSDSLNTLGNKQHDKKRHYFDD